MKDLRQEYRKNQLLEEFLAEDPFTQFDKWFKQAMDEQIAEPNAMILSSISSTGVDSRTVLLKGVEKDHFIFFTNYRSHKGQQLISNPACSLLFLWLQQERQIIVRGNATKISKEASEEYFNSRPRESKIGAWVSSQSEEIDSRDELEEKLKLYTQKFEGQEVPKPEHWGGFKVKPYQIEFWQGRPSRLHDRILYTLESGNWIHKRLQP